MRIYRKPKNPKKPIKAEKPGHVNARQPKPTIKQQRHFKQEIIPRKIQEADVLRIFKCYKNGESTEEIGGKYNVSASFIQDILDRKIYEDVPIPARLL